LDTPNYISSGGAVRARFLLCVLVCLCSWMWAGSSFADSSGYLISVQFENDLSGGGTDRHFTHGSRIECLTGPLRWIARGADKLPWFSSEKERQKREICKEEIKRS
jgi:hypothetical protein